MFRKTDSVSDFVSSYLLSGKWLAGNLSLFLSSRMGLIFALPDPQGGKDQVTTYHINRLKRAPQPAPGALQPSHVSISLCV